MILVLDSDLNTAISEQDNQEDLLLAIVSSFQGQNVTVKALNQSTLLSTSEYNGFQMLSSSPRRLVLGSRVSRSFTQSGTPTRVVFARAGVDLFEMTAGVGSGAARFTNSVNQLAVEKMQGLYLEADSELPETPVLNLVSSSPNRVVVEDWSSGSAVDVGTITLDTLQRVDRFADENLALDCKGWLEYGPSTLVGLPVLNGVQFSAKGFDIKRGGVYTQRSYRIMIMMRAIGNNTSGQPLVDGLFGDVRGVNHYPGPHKLRILAVDGTVLETIQMRDGLPINDVSLPPTPMDWTVTARSSVTDLPPSKHSIVDSGTRIAADKHMRPHVSAGSIYLSFVGDEPESSTQTRNKIPRVRQSTRPARNAKVRFIFGDTDVTAVGGNGFFHSDVVPEIGWSQQQIDAATNVAPGDPDIHNPVGYNWEAAMRNGWGYEPGAHGGITRRSGPGGVRVDRTSLLSEFYQMGLTMTTRPADGASTSAMARAHARNQANYPGYYPKDMLTLDPINTYSASPQPTIVGRDIKPVFHYYNGSNYEGIPSEIWIGDEYGNGTTSYLAEWMMPGTGLNKSTKGFVRNGWMPDSEHNVRNGSAWATLLYADPVFSRMAEHMVLESSLFSPIVSKGTWEIFGPNAAPYIADPGSFWSSRSNIAPFIVASMMWWVATNNGTYTRAVIEERLHAFFARWKQTVLDVLPSTPATASHVAYNMTGGLSVSWGTWSEGTDLTENANLKNGSGWIASFGIPGQYLGHFLLTAKISGLLDVLKQNTTSAFVLNLLEKQLEFHAKFQVSVPWAVSVANSGLPNLVLRDSTQGAVQSDISTVPSTLQQTIAVNPAPRPDAYFFLKPSATPGVSPVSLRGNVATYGRIQAAWIWWKYFAPVGSERNAGIAKIQSDMNLLGLYTPTFYNATFSRINYLQDVPALEE
jgi:hypothetical protein